MEVTVRFRPISRNFRSPVPSNWRIADPNWKPCVHSVHPRLTYLPFTVYTGAPSSGFHVRSSDSILRAEASNNRSMPGFSEDAVKVLSICIRETKVYDARLAEESLIWLV